MTTTVNVFNLQHFSLDDGPGIRTTVFFKGCPLNCIWCHNPESKSQRRELSFSKNRCGYCKKCAEVCPRSLHAIRDGLHEIDMFSCLLCGRCAEVCPHGALSVIGENRTVGSIMEEISRDDLFFTDGGGVTISGGEPLLQPEALCSLLRECKRRGYSTAVETSGYAKTEDVIKCAEYIDLFLYDCKETDAARHSRFVGVDNELILKNLEALDSIGARIILRCPIVPNCNDRREHIKGISHLAEKYKSIEAVELLPYHPLGISKAERVGKECAYQSTDFMEKERLRELLDTADCEFCVPVRIV